MICRHRGGAGCPGVWGTVCSVFIIDQSSRFRIAVFGHNISFFIFFLCFVVTSGKSDHFHQFTAPFYQDTPDPDVLIEEDDVRVITGLQSTLYGPQADQPGKAVVLAILTQSVRGIPAFR